MKKILLATVATVALSLPAMAQQSQTQQPSGSGQSEMNKPSPNEQTQGTQTQGQSQQQQSQQEDQQQQQAQEPVDPSNLSKDEVRQLQQTLDKKGFSVKKVDGVWGPNTEAALRKFQKDNNIKASGQLTQETISELKAAQGGESNSTTGAGSSPVNSSDQDQNPPKESGSGSGQYRTPGSKGQSQQ
jgi:peptidoglycan hydrolase-like protein with peptidoglycan-binding domain